MPENPTPDSGVKALPKLTVVDVAGATSDEHVHPDTGKLMVLLFQYLDEIDSQMSRLVEGLRPVLPDDFELPVSAASAPYQSLTSRQRQLVAIQEQLAQCYQRLAALAEAVRP